MSEPVSTGVAARMPNWVSFSPSAFLIGMPMTANIIQTAKQTVKATVLDVTTEMRFARRLVIEVPPSTEGLYGAPRALI